jgi:hypothetical protein
LQVLDRRRRQIILRQPSKDVRSGSAKNEDFAIGVPVNLFGPPLTKNRHHNRNSREKKNPMKTIIAFVIALILPAAAIAAEDASAQARDAAVNWLALVDAGQYQQSWNEASGLFRSHVTQAKWTAAATSAREPLGALQSRSGPDDVRLVTSLPGLPDGHYAIFRFNSTFANKRAAVETVTMMMDAGTWRAAGYFIR